VTIFFILSAATRQYEKTISLISALVRIESVGFASDLTEALEDIRQRYTKTPIFTSNIQSENMDAIMMSSLESGHSTIILPRKFKIKGKCACIGVEVDHNDPTTRWVINSIESIIQKYDVEEHHACD
jgi:hypothetical protein